MKYPNTRRENNDHTSKKGNNMNRGNRRRRNYRVGMVTGQCWSCRQKNVSCARLENGRFVCKDCDPVTYGEVARIEKERWISGT